MRNKYKCLVVLSLFITCNAWADCSDYIIKYRQTENAIQKVYKSQQIEIKAGKKISKKEKQTLQKLLDKEVAIKYLYECCVKSDEEEEQKRESYHGGSFDTGGDE